MLREHETWEEDFQSCVYPNGCFSSDFSVRASSDNTFAVIPLYGVESAISVVAGGPQSPKSTRLTFMIEVV